MADYDIPRWIRENVPAELHHSTLFKFNVKIGPKDKGHVVQINLLQDADIDYERLEQLLEEIPAQYIFWSALYSELKQNVTTLEIRRSMIKHQITKKTLDEFKSKGVRITNEQLNMLIAGDDRLTKVEAELAIMHKSTGKIWHMVESIRMRSEHCRSLAGFKRQDKEQSSHT